MNKEESKKIYGKNLKRLRLQKGMSQEELAHALGFKNRSSINKIEVGRSSIPTELIAKTAEVLGVSPLELFDEGQEKEQEFLLWGEEDEYDEKQALVLLDKALSDAINSIGNNQKKIDHFRPSDPDFFLYFRQLSKKNQDQVINYTKFLLETQKTEEAEKKGAQG